MSKKEDALFKEWVDEQKTKLAKKPEKLAAFEAFISDDEEAREIFRGAHRGEDYYRRLNELNDRERQKDQELANQREALEQRQAELMGWYEEAAPVNARLTKEKAEIAARLVEAQEQLRALGLEDDARRLDVTGVETMVKKGVDDEELVAMKKQMQAWSRGLPALLGQLAKVTHKITKEDWNIDPAAIIDYSSKKNVDLEQAFNELTRDEREKREEKRQAELAEKWKEEGRREAMSRVASPDFHRPAGPSIVDTLRTGAPNPQDRGDRVRAAAQEFITMGQGS